MQDYQCLSHAYAHKPLAVGLYRLTDDHVPRNQFGRNNPFLDFICADSLGEMIRPSYICRYLAGKCHLIAHHYLRSGTALKDEPFLVSSQRCTSSSRASLTQVLANQLE